MKVALTQLFQSEVGMRLDSAKYTTDALLENSVVDIEVETPEQAILFAEKAARLGVTCEIVDDKEEL